MEETIVVLAEVPLQEPDAVNLKTLAEAGDTAFVVVIPEDSHRNVLKEFLHHLSLLEFSEAFQDLSHGQPGRDELSAEARHALQLSLDVLDGAGLKADGLTVPGNAVEAMVRTVTERNARQAVVVTRPHVLADTLHRDWANRAQDKLGVPVLHLYAGSGFIGDS
ncbi:hypothetical protein GC088_08220 [Arthrobacter sp. JZ12]|uniref:hypothetical protein n=1 Tax=Arthrobacter sp. JZ12 TaxID=2654190 RepID=UPI002B479991|nr:hypothetical protein [Arthrobacter sp. JZ12]WRH25055.1 hypothetical protein GC088_08220 [Arthrobacter sp. JZ12]